MAALLERTSPFLSHCNAALQKERRPDGDDVRVRIVRRFADVLVAPEEPGLAA